MNKEAQLNNQRFEIIVDDIKEYVDANIMATVSGLFSRRYIEKINNHDKKYSIDFSDIKHKEKEIKQYFNICKGSPAELTTSEIYTLLLIAEEWESPNIVYQMKLLLDSNTSPEELLAKLTFDLNSKQDIAKSFIDLIAAKCNLLYQNPSFKNIAPPYLCSILQNPNCAFPRRDLFDKFIIGILNDNGVRCVSLVKFIDCLSTKLSILTKLDSILEKHNLSLMFPNVKKILYLRNCEKEFNNLKIEYQELKKENKALQEKVEISDSLIKTVNDLRSKK